ncbi:hydrogenase maturation nickel metallochaperone HypA [Actinomadura luteofluorescens]|uniref:hydrogenase/urease maturation nickel metallochaperone HypA n=1 Tax=Actinomadura luteofluorescens TaxID=46163 RepID=UPI0015C6BC90|nr:hydrogenase maturation nickel metallochaperone HypA [Actinomadura glauciflava]MCR3740512.1 Hydrogenase-3 nickel incorporation protein HypA [Actinomadura glauciflava]
MHELAVTESVIAAISTQLPDSRVVVVHLEIGRLSGVMPDAVRFCFELAGEGTCVEGARLDITEPEGVGDCAACGVSFPARDPLAMCPCGSADVVISGGADLTIKAVEVADDV